MCDVFRTINHGDEAAFAEMPLAGSQESVCWSKDVSCQLRKDGLHAVFGESQPTKQRVTSCASNQIQSARRLRAKSFHGAMTKGVHPIQGCPFERKPRGFPRTTHPPTRLHSLVDSLKLHCSVCGMGVIQYLKKMPVWGGGGVCSSKCLLARVGKENEKDRGFHIMSRRYPRHKCENAAPATTCRGHSCDASHRTLLGKHQTTHAPCPCVVVFMFPERGATPKWAGFLLSLWPKPRAARWEGGGRRHAGGLRRGTQRAASKSMSTSWQSFEDA